MNKNNFPILKIIGWVLIVISIFPGLFPTALLWFKFKWWIAFAIILIVILVAFYLGIHSIKIAATETVSLLYKAKFALIIVAGFYFLIFSSLAISWSIGSYNDPVYMLFHIIFFLDAILFAFASWFSFKENLIPVPKLLIWGGILSLPIGLFAIIVGAYYSKKVFIQLNIKTIDSNVESNQNNYSTANNILPELFKCPNCGEELELDEVERKEKKFKCPECNSLINRNKFFREDTEITTLLPARLECPKCKEEVDLEDNERKNKQFTCPWCDEFIDLT